MLKDAEWAWVAGLFEGEGYIRHARIITGRYPYTQRWLTVTMTDLDVLQKLKSIAGGEITEIKVQKVHYKQQWRWKTTGWAQVENALQRMLPYLGERRKAAAEKLLGDPARAYPNNTGKRSKEL